MACSDGWGHDAEGSSCMANVNFNETFVRHGIPEAFAMARLDGTTSIIARCQAVDEYQLSALEFQNSLYKHIHGSTFRQPLVDANLDKGFLRISSRHLITYPLLSNICSARPFDTRLSPGELIRCTRQALSKVRMFCTRYLRHSLGPLWALVVQDWRKNLRHKR